MRLPALRRATAAWSLALIACAAFAGGVLAARHDAVPAPAAARPGAQASWRGFGVGNWPGATWRPYAASSPFNQPIPARVRVHPRSREMVRRILAFGQPAPIVAGTGGTEDDFNHPTYYARRGDPLYTLAPYERWGRSEVRGRRIRIPARAKPAPGDDGHMTVVQPDGWEYDFWRVRSKPRGGGVLRFAWGGRVRIDGDGLGGRATAAHFGTLAGIVRPPELAGGVIDHALFVVVSCAARGGRFGYGTVTPRPRGVSSFVHPARGGGSPCPARLRDAPPLGARLQLAMSEAQIAALGLPAWKTAVLRAFARYGGYIGDTGGPGFAIKTESSLTYTAFGRPDPLLAFGRSAHALGDPHVREFEGRYLFDLADGVDWARHLRVVVPPRRR